MDHTLPPTDTQVLKGIHRYSIHTSKCTELQETTRYTQKTNSLLAGQQERHINKKLSSQDSATCEPLVIAAEVQNSTLFHTPLVFRSRIPDYSILRSRLAVACRQPSPSCRADFHFWCTNITDRQTDVTYAHSISATCISGHAQSKVSKVK